jgi:hypothetical protein
MYTAVVDDIGLHNLVAADAEKARQRITEQVVADMTEVKRLVGVRRRVLYHHERRLIVGMTIAVVVVRSGIVENAEPIFRRESKVKETFDSLERSHIGNGRDNLCTEFLTCNIGALLRYLQKREHHDGIVTILVFASEVDLYRFRSDLLPVQLSHRSGYRLLKTLFDIHIVLYCISNQGAKINKIKRDSIRSCFEFH